MCRAGETFYLTTSSIE
nr:hypothetical protein [Halomicrobium salinisoli]